MERNSSPDDRIARRLAEIHATAPFWRARWESPGQVGAPNALARLPIVTPSDLAADEAEHPPFGSWRAPVPFARVGVPSREHPLEMLVWTAEDLEREARVGARALRAAGLEPGQRETNTLPGGLITPGSLIVGDAAEALGALDMPVGPLGAAPARATAFDFWERVRPDFAALDLAGARDLAALVAERGTSASALGIRRAALVTDLRDPEPEQIDLGVPLLRIGGLAEAFSLLATRSEAGVFSAPAHEVVIEVVDGQLLVTTLGHSAALVRYAPGARARLVESPDPGAICFELL